MNPAARSSAARTAVSALVPTALAVSAIVVWRSTPEPTYTVDISEEPAARFWVGRIVVVGSPAGDRISDDIHSLDFSRCAFATEHVALYLHLSNGVFERYDYKTTRTTACIFDVLASSTFPTDEEVDVMIPFDFEISTASSP